MKMVHTALISGKTLHIMIIVLIGWSLEVLFVSCCLYVTFVLKYFAFKIVPLCISFLIPVMVKSQLRFDLNRDWIASRDSIWPLRIRFSLLRFEIWFDLGRLEIRFSVWRFGTKSYGNEPGAVADMRVSVTADHNTRNIWSYTLSDDFPHPSSPGDKVPQHSSNWWWRILWFLLLLVTLWLLANERFGQDLRFG